MRVYRFNLVALISLSLLTCLQVAPVEAKILANQTQNMSASSGRWSAQLASATGAASSTAYQITWTGNSNKQFELISIINTGNFDLSAEHLTFSTAKSNGDNTNPPALTFELCTGNWDPTTFLCSGTITQVASATSGTVNFSRLLLVNQRLIFRVTNARNAVGNQITTFNCQTFRSDLRSGISFSS